MKKFKFSVMLVALVAALAFSATPAKAGYDTPYVQEEGGVWGFFQYIGNRVVHSVGMAVQYGSGGYYQYNAATGTWYH